MDAQQATEAGVRDAQRAQAAGSELKHAQPAAGAGVVELKHAQRGQWAVGGLKEVPRAKGSV